MDEISGAQRDILGATTVEHVRDWLASHVRERLGLGIDAVLFTDGVVGAVFGLRLSDGREVVLKALRPGTDVQRQQTVVRAQNSLRQLLRQRANPLQDLVLGEPPIRVEQTFRSRIQDANESPSHGNIRL